MAALADIPCSHLFGFTIMELDIDNTKHAKVMTIRFRDTNNREGVDTMQRMFDKGWKSLEPLSLGRDGYFQTVLYWPDFFVPNAR